MAAALLVAALGGGVVAVAVASLAGVGEHTTTVREVGGFALPSNDVDLEQSDPALSLRDIYRDDAPGVVQVTIDHDGRVAS